MDKSNNRLRTVQPDLTELLPTPGARAAYEEAAAALEAGRLVRELRQAAGLTQVQLADRLNVSQARVSAIEKGEGRDGPSYGLLKRIAAACGVDWPAFPGAAADEVIVRDPEGGRPEMDERPVMRSGGNVRYARLVKGAGGVNTGKVLDLAGRTVGDILEVRVASRGQHDIAALRFDPRREAFVAVQAKGHAGGRRENLGAAASAKPHGHAVEG
ncbi:helix-turn-helix transcriptional regulator [Roseomonas chloroacetimidivorans]|jgi:transcriptional regulator with XRE-family HTH domain|uniref:helix-turn-helix transcriptional regulator n=1 Tax=Roseomonas chloroacetimidivorans TaxID=1766656 RepID=UPI003C787EE5